MEKIHGISSIQKKYSWQSIFICEPFITLTNNTNSDVTKKNHRILSLDQKK